MKVSRRRLPLDGSTWNLDAMPKVMVVDDEESLLEAIRYALSREGMDVVTARAVSALVGLVMKYQNPKYITPATTIKSPSRRYQGMD